MQSTEALVTRLTLLDRPRPKVLYLVHRVPYPPDKGDRIRAFHVLKWLSQRAAVHLACLADEPVTEELIAGLEPYCDRLAVVPLGKWSRWVRALASLARRPARGAAHLHVGGSPRWRQTRLTRASGNPLG